MTMTFARSMSADSLLLPLRAQRDSQVITGLLEVRLEGDRLTKCSDSASQVVLYFQGHPQTVVGLRILRIQPRRGLEFFERLFSFPEPAQGNS